MQNLIDLVDRVRQRQRDNAQDEAQAKALQDGIERARREANNEAALKNLDRHWELRGGCYRGEYDER